MKAVAIKNYMSIAVSVRTTSCVVRNSGGAIRQESTPKSETSYSFETLPPSAIGQRSGHFTI
jgi:hypothetical protein